MSFRDQPFSRAHIYSLVIDKVTRSLDQKKNTSEKEYIKRGREGVWSKI